MEECSTLIRWLNAGAGERILDIGCGDGYYDSLIAKTGAYVVGVDINEASIATARRLYGREQLEFLNKNAEESRFPDESFDKAVSFCVLEHLDRDEQVMRNIAAALKPGGSLVFSADSLTNTRLTTRERTWHQQRYAVNTFYTLENVQEKLDRAGFDILKTKYILTTRFALVLVRFSWILDALPGKLAIVKTISYFGLVSVWALVSFFPRLLSAKNDKGLTLLVSAQKRG
jgi:SAM-dependent methyltransferase